MNKTFAIVPLVVLTSLSIAISLPLKANALEIDLGFPRIRLGSPHRDYDWPPRSYWYSVYYRSPEFGRWRLAGNYRDPDVAEQVAYDLRRDGYITRVVDRDRF